MITPEIVASFAALFTMISYIPQAIKTIKTRDTKSISFWMYVLSMVGVILWLVYGLMIGNYPIIFKNIAVIGLSGIILYIKVKNIFNGKDEKTGVRFFKKTVKKLS
jgi:MtN3 and saliva related transmembrane protein